MTKNPTPRASAPSTPTTASAAAAAPQVSAAASDVSFEDALRRLEAIVSEMERADLPLETAFARFEEGTRLARLCQEKLATVEARLTELLDSGEERAVTLAPE